MRSAKADAVTCAFWISNAKLGNGYFVGDV